MNCRIKLLFPLVVLAAVFAFSGRPASAQNYYFTNDSGDGLWTNPANWLLLGSNPPVNALPTASDYAYLRSSTATIVTGIINAATLDMQTYSPQDFAGTLQITTSASTTVKDFYGGFISLNSTAGYGQGTLIFSNPAMFHATQINAAQAAYIRPFINQSITLDKSSSYTGALGLTGGYGDSSSINNYGRIAGNSTDYSFFAISVNNAGIITGDLITGFQFDATRLLNADYGQIIEPATGRYLNFVDSVVTNNALAQISASSNLSINSCAFTNYGSINVTGATLNIFGNNPPYNTPVNFVNSDAGRIQIFNGKLEVNGPVIAGQLSLSNSDLQTDSNGLLLLSALGSSPATGPLTIKNLILNGGTIQDGKLNALLVSSPGGTTQLANTAVNGMIDGSANSSDVYLTHTTLIGGTIHLKSGTTTGATLDFSGSGANMSTIDNTTLQCDGSTGSNLNVFPNSEVDLGPNTIMTGAIGQVGFIYGGQSGSKLVNNGLIQTNGAGVRTFASPAILINNGAIKASGGASLNFGYGNNQVTNSASGTITTQDTSEIDIYDGVFYNNGMISLANGRISMSGGVFYTGNTSIPNSGLYAYNASTVNVAQGLPSSFLNLSNTAVGNVTGGAMNYAYTYNASTLNLSGGQARNIYGYDSSHLNFSGGTITSSFSLNNESDAKVSGGQLGSAYTYNSAALNVTAGQISNLNAYGSSTINVSGGQIGSLYSAANINVTGTNLTKTLIRTSGSYRYYNLNGTLSDGTVWNNKQGTEYGSGIINVFNIVPASPATVRISAFLPLYRDGSLIRASFVLTNIGSVVAQNVAVTGATLGGQAASSSPLPSIATLASGASVTINVAFPAPASGTKSVLTLSGTYTGGKFGGSYRVTSP